MIFRRKKNHIKIFPKGDSSLDIDFRFAKQKKKKESKAENFIIGTVHRTETSIEWR